MEPDIAGVLRQFKTIKKHANQLLQAMISAPDNYFYAELEVTVEEFNNAKAHYERISLERKIPINLRNMKIENEIRWDKQRASLRVLDMECDKAVSVLESIATPLSKDELDKLTALRKELEKLSDVLPDIYYERNLKEAIDEYEKGDYLASVLISGRVIIYALNQIPGESDKEKVKFLRDNGIVEKERKDIHESIIKASRKARNFFSHDIKVFPTPSEAHSLLGDAIGILKIVSKVLEEKGK